MIKAFVFGLTIAIAIGPIAILIINRGLSTGLKSGVMSGAGVALADFTYGIIAFSAGTLIVGFLQVNHLYFKVLTAVVLLLFGLWMLRGSFKVLAIKPNQEQRLTDSGMKYLASTYLLTIVNPLTVVMFLGFSGQLISPVTGFAEIVLLAAAIFAGSLLVQLALACFGAILGQFIKDPRVIKFLNIASSTAIILFGLAGLYSVL